jgi:hypothetical protein
MRSLALLGMTVRWGDVGAQAEGRGGGRDGAMPSFRTGVRSLIAVGELCWCERSFLVEMPRVARDDEVVG